KRGSFCLEVLDAIRESSSLSLQFEILPEFRRRERLLTGARGGDFELGFRQGQLSLRAGKVRIERCTAHFCPNLPLSYQGAMIDVDFNHVSFDARTHHAAVDGLKYSVAFDLEVGRPKTQEQRKCDPAHSC